MRNLRAITALAVLLSLSTVSAEISIDSLISESDLSEGPIPMRDMPGWRGAKKVMIAHVADTDLEVLEELHPDTEFIGISRDAIADAVLKADGVDAIVGLCNDRVIAAARNAVWIQIFSSGAEHCVSVPAVAAGRAVLTNMQKMSAPVIGEHAVAMMLALARGLPVFAKGMKQGEWMRRDKVTSGMFQVSGKTMLVIGLGGIGTAAAQRSAALGMRVLAIRNSRREGPPYVEYVGLPEELLDMVSEADVIVNALPLTDATRKLLDARFFAAARRGALFINVGRGATVDTDALTDAIRTGQIGGAGLDVTDPEPLPADHVLWQFDNVIITPHVASRGSERERHFTLLKENLRRFATGDPLLNVVDPERGY